MASRFVLPFSDVGNGISPSDGSQLFFFSTGTSSPKDTFSDEALTTANTNPVVSDSDGLFGDIWMPDGGRYKVQLKDKNNVQAWESDAVIGGVSSQTTSKTFDTVAAMVASTELNIGDTVETAGYLTKGDGGDNRYEVVAAATGTVDGGSFINLATHQAKGLFPGDVIGVKQFGANGDGATDDSAIFLNALTFADGKVSVVGGTSGFLLDTSLAVPKITSLEGDYTFIDPRNGIEFANYPSRIILNSAATITLNESSALRGLPIIRKGIVIPANAAEVALFAGKAVATAASTSGQYVGHCAIVGFNQAIETDTATNTEQLRCEYLNIDCTNGLNIENVLDVAYVENVHCWPSASIGVAGVVDADLQRAGTAFQFKNGGDWNKWTSCFSFGYQNGYVVDACNSVTSISCGADYTVTQTTNPIGHQVINASAEVRFIGAQAAGQNIGIFINSSSANNHVSLIGCNTWDADTHHVLNDNGQVFAFGCRHRGGTANGVTPNDNGPTVLSGTSFESIGGNAINSQATTNIVRHSGCTFTGTVGSNVLNPYKPIIASADPLVLNGSDTLFEVTGTTNIGTINNAADYAGKTVTLKFTGILTLSDGGASLFLAGNFVTTGDDTLILASDGTAWYEVSRSAN